MKTPKFKVSVHTITAEQAAQNLKNLFAEQRPPKANHIKELAAEMSTGNWRVSSDAIVFIKGKLANGQNRQHAQVLSGVTCDYLVLETEDDELYKVLDSGKPRSVADVIRGDYAKEVSSSARWVVMYDLDIISPAGTSAAKLHECTRTMMIEFAQDNAEQLRLLATKCCTLYRRSRVVSPSIAAATAFIGERDGTDPERVQNFITSVYSGQTSNDAARDFRERIINSQIGAARLGRHYIFALIMKSLRAYLADTRLGVVRINVNEPFPRLK